MRPTVSRRPSLKMAFFKLRAKKRLQSDFLYVVVDTNIQDRPVVLKVVDIYPQGSIGPSKESINSHKVEWGSLNGP